MRRRVILMKAFIIKTSIILLSSFLISTAIMSNLGTYSWFTSTLSKGMNVSAASTSEILKKLEVESVNPKEVRIQKADNLKITPVVYFSIEGDAADFGIHINPIRLKNANEKADIKVNVTLGNLMKLLSSYDNITGVIRVKYLNEFIDEGRSICFTREFLINKFFEEIDVPISVSPGDISDETINTCLSEIIKYTAGNFKIENGQNLEENKTSDSTEDDSLHQLYISAQQEKALDIIVPGIKDYIIELNDKLAVKDEEIADKDRIIQELNLKISELENSLSKLQQLTPKPTQSLDEQGDLVNISEASDIP